MFSKTDLRKLIVPLIVEQVLAMTIGMADTIMVSSCGEVAVSGVSLVDTINILLINIFAALATGGAVVASQYLGNKDHQKANEAAKQLVYVTAILATLIATICLVFHKPLLALVFGKIDTEVMNNAQIYFMVSAVSYPFISLYNGGAALFRAMGNSKISMYNSIIMNLINVVGNAILIYIFNWGVFGAAFATLVSRIIGSMTMLYMLRKPSLLISVRSYLHFKLDFKMIKTILQIGIPTGLENGMFQIGKILVAGIVTGFGTASIAANAVANNIAGLEIIPGAAMGLAMVTVVGQCVGANDYKAADHYIKYLMKLTYIFMFILDVLILLSANPLLELYALSGETMDIAYQLLFWHTVFAITVWPLAFTLPNAFRAANDAKFTMIVSIFSMWAFRICLCLIFAKYTDLGVLGVWLGMFADWIFRMILFVWRQVSGTWKNKQLI
ncbi:MAG: MATE family efflux transporter [Erysipelotrichaceae bacterium]|nr:MATE family efflux transporter [Erysipelotrichaceae bacterium]